MAIVREKLQGTQFSATKGQLRHLDLEYKIRPYLCNLLSG